MKNCKVALMSVADIRNYGDVLFSFIARQEISKRIPNADFFVLQNKLLKMKNSIATQEKT